MSETHQSQRVEILLVEDNPGDIRLTREAFKDGQVHHRITVACDGEQALTMLRREGKYMASPRPDLILLDLNLPKRDGHEVLAEIKSDPQLKRIPVIVLTTSAAERDILATYDLHANAYITKPVDFDHFIQAVKTLEEFWLRVARLPRE